MPGDLITTSTSRSALAIRSAPNADVTLSYSCGMCASGLSSSSISRSAGWRFRRNSNAARPSRPSPQTATRLDPRSATRIEHGHVGTRNPMWMLDLKKRAKVGRFPLPQRSKGAIELPYDDILAPIGMTTQVRHHGGALSQFADTFERLMLLQAAQLGKSITLGLIVEKVVAEDFDQLGFLDRRGEREEHEPAFRTIAAPFPRAGCRELPEGRIAAPENSEIFGVFREAASDFDFRQRSQQRKVGDTRRDVVSQILREVLLKLERFAVLMVDVCIVDLQVWRTGGVLIRHGDDVIS